jgi:hypothetical protein
LFSLSSIAAILPTRSATVFSNRSILLYYSLFILSWFRMSLCNWVISFSLPLLLFSSSSILAF